MFNKLTIKAKIIILIVSSLSILALIISIFSITKLKESLINQSYAVLTSSRDSKANQIENFFLERIGDVNVLAKVENLQILIEDLNSVDKELNINPDVRYPVEHQLVKKITSKHEDFFQTYMSEYGYYDIFLIDSADGHVIYTAAKESDYGENLNTGYLKESGLGKVFHKTLKNQRTTFVDMKPYEASNNAPAMFLGTPVKNKKNQLIAVLVFQISDKSINKIMQFREGYGQSQEDYLIGHDKLMRSDSYLDPEGHSLQASFANNATVDTKASINAIKGKANTEIVIDYNGNPVLSAYKSIKIGQDFSWAILSEIDEAEILSTPNAIRNIIVLASVIIFVIIVIISLIVINKMIVKRLEKFQNGLLGFFNYINRESQTVKELDTDSFDEIGIMSKVVNENIIKAKKGIEEDRSIIQETIQVLSEFEQGDLCQRVHTTSSNPALQELTKLLNQMGEKVEQNIENILNVLEEYSNYNYLNKVDQSGIKEHLLKLANGVNDLGLSITNMLTDSKKIGVTLDQSSDTLLENVDTLNKNSNETAAALEETAAALEEMTANIRSNSDNIIKMSNFANELSSSAQTGLKQASSTTEAMDEINEQVTSINEAISVIDQIAFQTNILSLNAAVEAATAGEAGKGFAVVAQEVRNLAARSSEAAKEIKELVESANLKANEGKSIADNMIHGYNNLNENITNTLTLIKDIESSSKEQSTGISQINDAVNQLDQQTQENVSISNITHEIAVDTDKIAKRIVHDADSKQFDGKNKIKKETSKSTSINKKVPIPRKDELKIISNTKDNNEWESF